MNWPIEDHVSRMETKTVDVTVCVHNMFGLNIHGNEEEI